MNMELTPEQEEQFVKWYKTTKSYSYKDAFLAGLSAQGNPSVLFTLPYDKERVVEILDSACELLEMSAYHDDTDYKNLKQMWRDISAAQGNAKPVAWIKGFWSGGAPDSDPPDWNIECIPGSDPPQNDGTWVPLYASPPSLAAAESFDAWQNNPYTKALEKSITTDYILKADLAAAEKRIKQLENDLFQMSLQRNTATDNLTAAMKLLDDLESALRYANRFLNAYSTSEGVVITALAAIARFRSES